MKQKKKFWPLFLLLGLLSSNQLYSSDIGSVSFGTNVLLRNEWRIWGYDHKVNQTGIHISIFLPVRIFKEYDLDYKVSASYHKILSNADQFYFWSYREPLESFFTCNNELLFGRKKYLSKQIYILPQIGLGVTGETLFSEDDGFAEAFSFYDLSLRVQFSSRWFDYGVVFNYINGFLLVPEDNYPCDRISISLILSK